MNDPTFCTSRALAERIEGMLSHFSMAAMDSILAYQADQNVRGDIVELGVFRGKSAALMAGRLRSSETLHLYDIADSFDRDALEPISASLAFNVRNTLDLRKRNFKKRSVRFCHIDASHQYEPTLHEMALADSMLSEDGVLCLDDYTNLNYSQILAATFKYLFTKRTDLTMFMVTSEKAYLCRRKHLPRYLSFVFTSLLAMMADRGVNDACLARTDDTLEYGAVHLRPKQPGETDDFYGASIYRPFFKVKDHSSIRATLGRWARPVYQQLRRWS